MKNTAKFLAIILIILCSFKAYSQKIDLLILNSQYDLALQEIAIQISNEPTGDLHLKQGIIYSKLNDYEKAFESFRNALDYTPNNPIVLTELGETLSLLGNYSQASSFFQQAILASANDMVLKGKLGRVYINQKEYVKAFETFFEIYQADTTNVYWNKQFAFSAHKVNRLKLAISLYEKVILNNPHDVGSYLNLATLYRQLNADSLALNTTLRGLEIYPENPSLLLKLANQYYGLREYEKAISPYEQYLSKGDSIYSILKNYGICLYFTGHEQKSIQFLETCIYMAPDDPFVLFYLSLAHKKLTENVVAEAYMNTAIEAATPYYLPEMYHHLGQILGQQQKYEESVAALKEAYKQDPTDFEILFEIATTYEKFNNNITLAINFYRMYLLEAKEEAKNATYALNRMDKIKEMLFMGGE